MKPTRGNNSPACQSTSDHDAAGALPRTGLIAEAAIEDLRLAGRPAHGTLEQGGDLPFQHRIGLEADGVAEAFLLQQAQQLRAGKRGVAAEELGDVEVPVAVDHRQQHPPPVLGTATVAPAEQDPLQVAELVEQEQRVVAGAGEVAVVGACPPGGRRSRSPNCPCRG